MKNKNGSIVCPRFDLTAWSSYDKGGRLLFHIEADQPLVVVDTNFINGSKTMISLRVLAPQGVGWILEDNVRYVHQT